MTDARHNRRHFLEVMSTGIAATLVPRALRASQSIISAAASTGYLDETDFIPHVLSPDHPESPQRLQAIAQRMRETGLAQRVSILQFAGDTAEVVDAIVRVHTQEHVDSVDACPTTGAVARNAVAGVLAAVEAVDQGTVRNAFCPVRPPGHHAHSHGAGRDGQCQGEGFCFYNNVAIAARYAQEVLGYEKILIIDWDYHHGNGTQDVFYEDSSVLFFSTHNFHAYPGTGDPLLEGEGEGKGYTVNVHLDCNCTDDDIIAAWDTRLLPKAHAFKPDFVLISAGFDSRVDDTLGCFDITDDGFVALSRKAMEIAQEYCGGKLVSVLEGGYNTLGLASAVTAHVATLMGEDAPSLSHSQPLSVPDPASVTPCVRNGLLHVPLRYRRRLALDIFDVSGRKIRRLSLRSAGPAIDLRTLGLSCGRYFLSLESNGRESPPVLTFEIMR